MGWGIKAVEDRPTPKAVYNSRLYLETSIIALGSFLFGYDSAFIGTTIKRDSFESDFGLNDSNETAISSNITSAFQAGAWFGALFSFFSIEWMGRKKTLQASVVIFLVGAVLMTAATNQLSYIYAGRVLTGLGCGAITANSPAYIAELSVPSIRGILTGLFEIVYQFGSLIGFWINYGISQNMSSTSVNSWRIPMAVQIIPAGMLLFGTVFLHESPLWLMRRVNKDKAYQALKSLRNLPLQDEYVQQEISMTQSKLNEEESIASQYQGKRFALWRAQIDELSQPGMRNRLLLVFVAFLLQNFGGAAAINYYSPTLFASLGISDVNLYTGIYGVMKAATSVVFFIFLIDSVGRRKPLILSSVACSLCLWYVGAYVKIGDPAAVVDAGGTLSPSTAAGGKAATAMIMIYAVCWSFGLNGIPWIVSAEIFPGSVRTFTGAYTGLVQWLTQFGVTKALPYMFASLGYGTWFFFASVMMTAAIWSYFFVPETKGTTMEQLDVIFGYTRDRNFGLFEESLEDDDSKKKRDEQIESV